MTWLLTSKTGSSRGESWAIGPKPIVLGRSLSCDITIGDPTVSRKHCEVKLEGESVLFRDLGSRNVTLINGKAVDACRLMVGDELSLGTESFIVTRTTAANVVPLSTDDERHDSTVSLGEAYSLLEQVEGPLSPPFPSTVQDVVRLYRFGRKLSKAHNEAEFATLCLHELEELFPARVTLAVCCVDPNGMYWYPDGFVPTEELKAQVANMMEDGEASLNCHRSKRLFFKDLLVAGTAPLVVMGRCRGALVLQSSARHYVPEPGTLALLNALAQTASPYLGSLEHREAPSCRDDAPFELEPLQFLGQSAAVEELRSEIEAAARTRLNTLITGEPGTGKEMAGHLIHSYGPAPQGPIVSTNCMTLSGPHFMAALVGSSKREPDRSISVQHGLLDRANGGTLLLREVDSLTPANQHDLFRVLERGTYERAGGQRPLTFHGRIVATSSKDLELAASQGAFRRDLLKMIGRQRIHIKPLRRRPTDIRALAEYFFDTGRKQGDHQLKGLTEEALDYLQDLPLKGNAMELRHTIAQAARQSRSEWLGTHELRSAANSSHEEQAVLEPLENAERTLISAVLTQCDGNLEAAAEILGLPQATLKQLTAQMEGGAPRKR